MTISFECEHCRKEVKAPDDAAGKRGKCPYCGMSNYIPAPVSDDDLIPLAEEDPEEERRRKEEIHSLMQMDRAVLAEGGGEPSIPLEHREDLKAGDLYHFIVNYCLDMAAGKLDRAKIQVEKLKPFGYTGKLAVDDFLSGNALEPALDTIPSRVLQGFLRQLKDQLTP